MSDFMALGVGDQELLDLVEHQATFQFMKENKEKFSNTYFKKMTKTALGFEEDEEIVGATVRVRKGEVGQGKEEISPEQLEAMNQRWKDIVQPVCGYASYEEMRRGINQQLGRFFDKE